MDLLHLVDRLEELVAGAQKMPIGNRAIVDRRRMLDLIDQMRIAVPREVREAQDIVAQRDAIRREAEEEGRIIVAQSEERAADLVEEHAITQGAKRRAEEIALEAERRLEAQIEAANQDIQARIRESRRVAREQMAAADEYARELLQRLERQLQAFQNSVHAGIEQLEPSPATYDPTVPLDDIDFSPVRRAGTGAAGGAGGIGDDLARSGGPTSGIAHGSAEPPSWTNAAFEAQEEIGDDDELEDLLGRQRPLRALPGRLESEQLEEADPGVIDDFENQPLDDDPVLRPAPGPQAGTRDQLRRFEDFD